MTRDRSCDKAYVRLIVRSESLAAESITDLVGMTPDLSWRPGDYRPHTVIIERTHGWVVDCQCPTTTDLHTQVSSLVSRLAPFAQRIASLADRCTIEFSCVLYTSRANPGLNLPKSVIAAIDRLNADLDIDVYCLPAAE